MYVQNFISNLASAKHIDYIPGLVSHRNKLESLPVAVLLDTGALHGSYMSKSVANWLVEHHVAKVVECSKTICGINDSFCQSCMGKINITLQLRSEISSESLSFSIEAATLDSAVDIILGRQIIKEFNLVAHFPPTLFL